MTIYEVLHDEMTQLHRRNQRRTQQTERDVEYRRILANIESMQHKASTEPQPIQALRLLDNAIYDVTIDGLAHVLELRDAETKGHSRRVTDLSLRLAEAAGCSAEECMHIRRGALLHDIGKMAIPDNILLKSGPLTDEEQAIMRQHPTYAYRWLSRIPFLQKSLDIPYCHHEKWDGTGYPRGLQGEQIPLAARIFAVVDVWDTLCSDTPYRQAWPVQAARTYIQEQAGIHFDPRIVHIFLTKIQDVPNR